MPLEWYQLDLNTVSFSNSISSFSHSISWTSSWIVAIVTTGDIYSLSDEAKSV